MSGGTILAEGFQYWPVSSVDQTLQTGVTIPERGFNKIIRCSYWINGNNPIGTVKTRQSTNPAKSDCGPRPTR